MDRINQAWAWIREWSWTLLLGLLSIVGIGWAIRRKHIEAGEVRDAFAVERAQRKIAELRGKRDHLLTEVGREHVLVRQIDDELEENRREVVEAHAGLEVGLTDVQVIEAYKKLGY